jgi:hypothetical protein
MHDEQQIAAPRREANYSPAAFWPLLARNSHDDLMPPHGGALPSLSKSTFRKMFEE